MGNQHRGQIQGQENIFYGFIHFKWKMKFLVLENNKTGTITLFYLYKNSWWDLFTQLISSVVDSFNVVKAECNPGIVVSLPAVIGSASEVWE